MSFLETVINLIIAETYRYMERVGRADSFTRFPYLRVRADSVTEEELAAAEKSEGIQAVRYQRLLMRLSGGTCDAVIQTVTDLALAVMLVPEFAAYLNYYTGGYATLQLAYELLGVSLPDCGEVKECLQRLKCVFDVEKNPLPACACVAGNQELLSYLTGDDSENPAFREWAEWFFCGEDLQPMYVREELAEAGAELLAAGTAVLQISGAGGRRFLAKHIAKRLKTDLCLFRRNCLRRPGRTRRADSHRPSTKRFYTGAPSASTESAMNCQNSGYRDNRDYRSGRSFIRESCGLFRRRGCR